MKRNGVYTDILFFVYFISLSLRKDQTKQEDVERHLLVFYTCGTSSLVEEGVKNKRSYFVASCAVQGFARAPAASGRERR